MKKMMTTKKIWSNKQIHIALLITAAGSSIRFGKNQKKEYLLIDENDSSKGTVLGRCLETFLETNYFSTVVITIPENQQQEADKALSFLPLGQALIEKKLSNIKFAYCTGGSTRQASVFEGLKCIKKLTHDNMPDVVLIHDGARPFVSAKIIESAIKNTEKSGASVPAIPVVDTQKQADENGRIISHLDRNTMFAVQTPQAFAFMPLFEAHKQAENDGQTYTDDTEIWGKYCTDVYLSYGDVTNKKITYKEDLPKGKKRMNRVGLGTDSHRLVEGRRLMIGGVHIPYEKGEDGHSDGDVLLHALIDSLLGATCLGDVGELFPPTEAKWKDSDSKVLLSKAFDIVKKDGWKIENIDCVIKIEEPKILPFRNLIRESISNILQIDSSQIFVKAKSGEKLGAVGSGLAVEAEVVCLLSKST
jgi:2-C-methyl-D-erythritol 4-phosphate cytidylyltransferase/2-C-methyl-D-erythritol 2,4-cyclodiphosphate synthase